MCHPSEMSTMLLASPTHQMWRIHRPVWRPLLGAGWGQPEACAGWGLWLLGTPWPRGYGTHSSWCACRCPSNMMSQMEACPPAVYTWWHRNKQELGQKKNLVNFNTESCVIWTSNHKTVSEFSVLWQMHVALERKRKLWFYQFMFGTVSTLV